MRCEQFPPHLSGPRALVPASLSYLSHKSPCRAPGASRVSPKHLTSLLPPLPCSSSTPSQLLAISVRENCPQPWPSNSLTCNDLCYSHLARAGPDLHCTPYSPPLLSPSAPGPTWDPSRLPHSLPDSIISSGAVRPLSKTWTLPARFLPISCQLCVCAALH